LNEINGKGDRLLFPKEITMKIHGYYLLFLLGAVAVIGIIGCGQEAPKTVAPLSKSATESRGQAIVDSVKTPLDKSRQVEGTLKKAADKTADTVKDATQ
jgi:hypothetical protein